MSLEGVNGILNVESAALHAPQVGVANTNPQHILSVGSNLYVSGDSSDVLTVDGNVVCEGVKVGLIEVTPSYDFESVTTVGNVTSNTLQFTNPDTGFVATGNVEIGKTLTVSGFRITATAEANDDLAAITAAGADTSEAIHITNATNSTSPLTGALRLGTNTIFSGLGVSGNVHVGQSLVVDTDTLFVDSTTDRVGIGKSDPATPLDVDGTVTATTFVGALAADQITGTLAVANGGTGTTTSTGTGSVVRSIAPTFTGTTTFSGEVDVTGNMFYTKPASILVDSNVVTEYTGPHERDGAAVLKKYPEIVFDASKVDGNDTTNTYVQAGYTVTASSQQSAHQAWKAFDENNSGIPPAWLTVDPSYNGSTYLGSNNLGTATGGNSTTVPGEYIILQMPNKVKLKHFKLKERFGHSGSAGDRAPAAGKIYGSNDGTYWSEVNTFSGLTYTDDDDVFTTVNVNSSIAYNRFALVVTAINVSQNEWVGISDLRYYGYEEDPPAGDTSVDTTFTSIMNTPQTTGANVYTDAKLSSDFTNQVTGPTPVGTAAVHDNTNKYWEMNGQLTSNITVEANTFLEGDQPHAVSVWFNSSNLEANVSNTCVFSVSDQEKLDSVNLDLQSNTWHNLTYAYQGEGGSRVTYLDGRKVAEDQAEDTFGEYPPFAMTGYSQGGYVVSASSEMSGNNVWKGFGEVGTHFISSDSSFDGGDDTFNSINGPWVKITLPYKIKLSYLQFYPRNNFPNQLIQDGTIYASNDDISWVQIGQLNNLGNYTNSVPAMVSFSHNTCYNSYLLHITQNVTPYVSFENLRFYGHRENDLVRLPDPTNVLKYPHIAMTGPAQRGYVASASSEHSGSTFDGFNGIQEGKLFDNDSATFWHAETSGTNDHRYDGTADAAGGRPYGTDSVSNFDQTGINIPGEWVQLKFPHKLQISKVHIRARSGYEIQAPKDFAFYGSDTGSAGSWTLIQSFTGESPQDDGTSYYDITSNPAHYKYILMLITRLVGTTALSMAELEYYGTEEATPVPIQIGGGNIDKVANFRVYDKFIGEDQALEIWDAQKDEFGRAKSSMTLQKGRLGIGTTEPKGRLAVADEPDPDAYGLQRIPPKPASGYDTHIEGYGMFQVSTSNAGGGSAAAYWAFDHDIDRNNNSWRNDGTPYTSGTWNSTQTASTTENSNTHVGHWIQLYTPVKYSLKSHKVSARAVATYRQPYSAVVLGSTDGSTWNLLDTWTTIDVSRVKRSITIDNTTLYNYFRLVVKALENHGDAVRVDLGEWELYGIREQLPPKQSVLHDGQLTLTKNLTVPRIGPALDADDTPRRDRLVVEYNTSTNPTFEGAVRDTSGRGNDGVFVGTATYDATEKAFDTPNTTGIIRKNINLSGGNIPLSVSTWFRLIDTTTTTNDTIVCLGTNSTATGGGSFILRVNTDQLRINFEQSSNYTEFTKTISLGRWYHVVATYDGGTSASGRKLFIDGVEIAQTSTTGTITGVNLPVNPDFAVGMRTDISGYINGFISNFKLYDTALTASEVKTLYDMGRCDEGHHVMNFSKTRVGIGLGDGEAPRGALDVRGDIYGGCPVFFHATRTTHAEPTSSVGFNPIIWQQAQVNKGGAYSTTTGKFTAPIPGYYEFIYGGMTLNVNDRLELIPRLNNVRYSGPLVFISPDSAQQHRYGTATAIVYMLSLIHI